MKLLHLADLHLGKRVNEFSLLADQRHVLEQALALADRHAVDAVLLAGDLYDKPVPPAEAVELLDWFLTALTRAGHKVLAVSGNHDSPERLSFASGLLCDSGVYIAGEYGGAPLRITLEDEWGPVDFTLLPLSLIHIFPHTFRPYIIYPPSRLPCRKRAPSLRRGRVRSSPPKKPEPRGLCLEKSIGVRGQKKRTHRFKRHHFQPGAFDRREKQGWKTF